MCLRRREAFMGLLSFLLGFGVGRRDGERLERERAERDSQRGIWERDEGSLFDLLDCDDDRDCDCD